MNAKDVGFRSKKFFKKACRNQMRTVILRSQSNDPPGKSVQKSNRTRRKKVSLQTFHFPVVQFYFPKPDKHFVQSFAKAVILYRIK